MVHVYEFIDLEQVSVQLEKTIGASEGNYSTRQVYRSVSFRDVKRLGLVGKLVPEIKNKSISATGLGRGRTSNHEIRNEMIYLGEKNCRYTFLKLFTNTLLIFFISASGARTIRILVNIANCVLLASKCRAFKVAGVE